MPKITTLVVILVSIAAQAFGQSATKRYLYMSMPNGAQQEGRSMPPGVMIFDIDDGHKLVRRIGVPGFAEGIRGFAVNLKTHRAFYGTQNRRIGCIDLETDKVVWEKLIEA